MSIPRLGAEIPGQGYSPEATYPVPFTQQMLDVERALERQGDANVSLQPVDEKNVLMRSFSYNADWLGSGQEYNPAFPPIRPYTKQRMTNEAAAAYAGQKNVQIRPLDPLYSEVIIYSTDPYAVLEGQRFRENSTVPVGFTEQVMENGSAAPLLGDPNVDVQPIDDLASKVTLWDVDPLAVKNGKQFNERGVAIPYTRQFVSVDDVPGYTANNEDVRVVDDKVAEVTVWDIDPLSERTGQSFRENSVVPVEYTQQSMPRATAEALVGDANVDVEPVDDKTARVTTWNVDPLVEKDGQRFSPNSVPVAYTQQFVPHADVGTVSANTDVRPVDDKISEVTVWDNDPFAVTAGMVFSAEDSIPIVYNEWVATKEDADAVVGALTDYTSAEPINDKYTRLRQYGVDPFEVLDGQQYSPGDPFVVPFTQQTVRVADGATGFEGDANTEIVPRDERTAEVRIYDVSSIQADALEYSFSVPGTTSFVLPDVLESVTTTYNKAFGNGYSVSEPGYHSATGTSGSISASAVSSAQGSASIIPDVQVVIKQTDAQNVPVMHYFFYVVGSATLANIKTRLNTLTGGTVLDWPNFKRKEHTITCKGMQISVAQNATSRVSASYSPGSSSASATPYGGSRSDGASAEVGVSIRTVRIPPTIHGLITIADATDSRSVTVTVEANIEAITGSVAVSAITNEPATLTETANASVSPTSLAPTTITAIPTTGLYLKDVRGQRDSYGLTLVHAEVVNFSYFA